MIKDNLIFTFISLFLALIGVSCTPTNTNISDFEIEITRVDSSGLSPIKFELQLMNGSSFDLENLSINSSMGNLSAINIDEEQNIHFTLTPNQTGEHKVIIKYDDLTKTVTPLVLYEIHSSWGQPMMVEGLVNTEGYEDGVAVSSDGEYIFVQTGPMYFSSYFVMETPRSSNGCGGATNRLNPTPCAHPWVNTPIGDFPGKARPDFFQGRFNSSELFHNSNLWQVGNNQSPFLAFITMFYGFKKQSDGSFAEPFYLAFDDENDAIMGPFGMSFHFNTNGTIDMLFSLNDPSNPYSVDIDSNGSFESDSGFDVYHTTVTMNKNNILGKFIPAGPLATPPVRASPFASTLVDFGRTGTDGIAGTQGNSHLHKIDGITHSIWTDDEYDTGGDKGDLSVYYLDSGSLQSGSWSKLLLPNTINQSSPSDEIQPFFTGSELFFTSSGSNNPQVMVSNYSGDHSKSSLTNPAHWSSPEKVLGFDPDGSKKEQIIAIGEPNIATKNGETYLYFVYARVRGFDTEGTGLQDIDMQVGYIKKRP
ncbi:MAG: hypothetical protein AB8E15_10065 [Bdellovibrionales bacterium]